MGAEADQGKELLQQGRLGNDFGEFDESFAAASFPLDTSTCSPDDGHCLIAGVQALF